MFNFKKITRTQLNQFLEVHKTDEKVLDIGAGILDHDRFFPNRVTVDVDKSKKPEIVADAHSLPFEDGSFSKVVCLEVLEHLRDPRLATSEMKRVLKSGGELILSTRFMYPIHDAPNDFWRFTEFGLREIFKDWEIIDFRAETEGFSVVAVILQRMSFQSIFKFNKLTKGLILVFTYIFQKLNWLTKEEYGDIERKVKLSHAFSSGYYIVCRKK